MPDSNVHYVAMLCCVVVAMLNFMAQALQKNISSKIDYSNLGLSMPLVIGLVKMFSVLSVSMCFWVYSLSKLPLSTAYPLLSLVLVFSTFYECRSWSNLTLLKKLGIFFVLIGISMVIVGYVNF